MKITNGPFQDVTKRKKECDFIYILYLFLFRGGSMSRYRLKGRDRGRFVLYQGWWNMLLYWGKAADEENLFFFDLVFCVLGGVLLYLRCLSFTPTPFSIESIDWLTRTCHIFEFPSQNQYIFLMSNNYFVFLHERFWHRSKSTLHPISIGMAFQ